MSPNRVFLLLLLSLAAACAKSPVTNPSTGANDPPQIASVDVVEATPSETTLTRGESTDAIVPIKITHGYHVNANPPSFPYLKPLEIQVPSAEGISVESITYPDPLTRKFSFSPDQPLAVYEGEATVRIRLKADKSATPGKHNLSARLRVQACDDKVCYAPGEENLIVPVTVK
jgi:thiol:disulfide interchange protein DsbD